MPIRVYYHRTKNILLTQATGRIDLATMFDFYRIVSHLDIIQGFKSFGDYRQADMSGLTAEDLRRCKKTGNDIAENIGGNYGYAMIVRDTFEFGVGRMFEMSDVKEAFTAKVFRDFDEGLKWLDLSRELVIEIGLEGDIVFAGLP